MGAKQEDDQRPVPDPGCEFAQAVPELLHSRFLALRQILRKRVIIETCPPLPTNRIRVPLPASGSGQHTGAWSIWPGNVNWPGRPTHSSYSVAATGRRFMRLFAGAVTDRRMRRI